jgi:hypothetical protein
MNTISIVGSVSYAVTGAAYTFQPDAGVADSNIQNNPKPWIIRVWGDVIFHVAINRDATNLDMPVADQFNGILLEVPPGGSISVVKKAGQPDGLVWFTHVKRV